jgi:hypothetical protein
MSGEELLRAHGLRVTRPRVTVLDVLSAQPAHLEVEEIASRVRQRLDSVSIQAVYDVLAVLVRAARSPMWTVRSVRHSAWSRSRRMASWSMRRR